MMAAGDDDDEVDDEQQLIILVLFWHILCLSARFMLIRPTTKIAHLMLITKRMLFYAYQRV
jgi:hypothetical protein